MLKNNEIELPIVFTGELYPDTSICIPIKQDFIYITERLSKCGAWERLDKQDLLDKKYEIETSANAITITNFTNKVIKIRIIERKIKVIGKKR